MGQGKSGTHTHTCTHTRARARMSAVPGARAHTHTHTSEPGAMSTGTVCASACMYVYVCCRYGRLAFATPGHKLQAFEKEVTEAGMWVWVCPVMPCLCPKAHRKQTVLAAGRLGGCVPCDATFVHDGASSTAGPDKMPKGVSKGVCALYGCVLARLSWPDSVL